MRIAARVLTALVAIEHLWFMTLESFLWTSEFGRTTFKTTVEFAEASKALAANQGLYNGFLAAALVAGLVHKNVDVSRALVTFGLVCVIVAGIVGGITVSPSITVVQGAPAAIALVLHLRARPSA